MTALAARLGGVPGRARAPSEIARDRGRRTSRRCSCADGPDPVVRRRALRPVEPRRGGDGPDGHRARRRGRAPPTAGSPTTQLRRRQLVQLLPGRPREGRAPRHQRLRLRGRRASGTTYCATGDVDFAAGRCGRASSARVDFVLRCQLADGTIALVARRARAAPEGYALLTGSSSIFHSLRCAVAAGRAPRRGAARLGARRRAPRPRRRPPPGRLRAQERVRDGLVLPDPLRRARPARPATRRLDDGWERHVIDGLRRALRVDERLGDRRRDRRVRRSPSTRSG